MECRSIYNWPSSRGCWLKQATVASQLRDIKSQDDSQQGQKFPREAGYYPRWLCYSCLATFFIASKMCIIVRFWEYKMKTLTLGRELETFFICPIIPHYCQDLPLELFINAVVVFSSAWFDEWRCAGIQKCSQVASHAQQMDLSPTKDGLFSGNGEWMMMMMNNDQITDI